LIQQNNCRLYLDSLLSQPEKESIASFMGKLNAGHFELA
jgi:hypothetical protein